MGLLSDGGVHSHIDHLYGVVEMAKNFGLDKVYIHAFTDGRDVPPTSGIDFVKNSIDNNNTNFKNFVQYVNKNMVRKKG